MAHIVFFALLLLFVSMASIQAVNIESDTISDVQPVQGTPYRPQASKKGVLILESDPIETTVVTVSFNPYGKRFYGK
ncbi:hypothetical protein QR680_006546 [Steinernema hermaphroditum]|uniref:Uncharacterized protein n=1 Tax=Steinernema hermaphroditum TaxID=289476 RepID=A0AA39HVT0_9BILA|nr:hypothetical protein QR680_006546 [Steinernema hermaphroditum]